MVVHVNKYYIEGFGLDRKRAILIDSSKIGIPKGKKITDVFPDNIVDLSLRTRQATSRQEGMQKDVILKVDQWCIDYEEKIRNRGGIGFFLGGIFLPSLGINFKSSLRIYRLTIVFYFSS